MKKLLGNLEVSTLYPDAIVWMASSSEHLQSLDGTADTPGGTCFGSLAVVVHGF
jgi:hypothetical protein